MRVRFRHTEYWFDMRDTVKALYYMNTDNNYIYVIRGVFYIYRGSRENIHNIVYYRPY